MTPKEILDSNTEMYEKSIIEKAKLVGKQVLFVDDSQEMLNLISVMLRNKYNILDGYIIEPNPIFAKHVMEWFINKGIVIADLIKCAILDIDFGIYNKDVSVNDLIKIFLTANVPVVLFSAVKEDTWKKYVKIEYHSRVQYVDKTDPHSMNLIYTHIKEADEVNVV